MRGKPAAASHDYIKTRCIVYCVVMNAERIIERTSMIEKITKMICIARMRLFACMSPDLLLFVFLLAIFYSLINKMFGKGGCHCLFKFFDRDGLHYVRVCA